MKTDSQRQAFSDVSPATDTQGQLGHPKNIEHSQRLRRQLYQVTENVWTLVGNGLSNQTFVLAPEGLICIDTGECNEEMASALAEVRQFTQAPVAAVIYTHFHYVNGTRAILEDNHLPDFPVYGHEDIARNLARYGGEVGPRISRGMVYQFAISMPDDGPDGRINVGLGNFFRNQDHAPFTAGHMPVTDSFKTQASLNIAGLQVEVSHAPSDSDDSVTLWFPELSVCVNNLVWPALFNVFAIRGEEYRDPRGLLTGLEHMLSLKANHLLCTHGPPLSGADEIENVIVDYRDSIQLLWDQTVRAANKGLAIDELADFIHLPERFDRSYFTQQYYGVIEHHVKQIYTGLFGWFDESAEKLFPLPPTERATRLIAGFGGAEKVRDQISLAMESGDLRWALEMAGWLVRTSKDVDDRCRLAEVLKHIGQRTTSSNIRNWCLTRALQLEGTINLDRFYGHRFRVPEILAQPLERSVSTLRVLLVPEKCEQLDAELLIRTTEGEQTGLRIRRGIAFRSAGDAAAATVTLPKTMWAQLLGRKLTVEQLLADAQVTVDGDSSVVSAMLNSFDW
ncbi:MAG: MBL fold metallo-hydrolase [Pseudomonadales bacterium]|nr:MBL fold metallo-hydrolase [Pseudomonadales bacterium]